LQTTFAVIVCGIELSIDSARPAGSGGKTAKITCDLKKEAKNNTLDQRLETRVKGGQRYHKNTNKYAINPLSLPQAITARSEHKYSNPAPQIILRSISISASHATTSTSRRRITITIISSNNRTSPINNILVPTTASLHKYKQGSCPTTTTIPPNIFKLNRYNAFCFWTSTYDVKRK